jgi:hypothetical protein
MLSAGATVDEATAAYIVQTRKSFEDLRQVASQLAGVLVLAAAGSKNAAPDHPALKAAAELHKDAVDAIRSARVTNRAAEHHVCLSRAAVCLGTALRAAEARLDVDPILTPLRAGYDQLQKASENLPGFEMVSFDRACCAAQKS